MVAHVSILLLLIIIIIIITDSSTSSLVTFSDGASHTSGL